MKNLEIQQSRASIASSARKKALAMFGFPFMLWLYWVFEAIKSGANFGALNIYVPIFISVFFIIWGIYFLKRASDIKNGAQISLSFVLIEDMRIDVGKIINGEKHISKSHDITELKAVRVDQGRCYFRMNMIREFGINLESYKRSDAINFVDALAERLPEGKKVKGRFD